MKEKDASLVLWFIYKLNLKVRNDHDALIVRSQSLCLNCAYSDGNVGFLKGGTTGKTTLRVGLVKGIILYLNHKKAPLP